MANWLDELYKTKVLLAAIVFTVAGIAVMTLAHWSTTSAAPYWLTVLPVMEVGSGLFGFGILGIGLDYYTRRVDDERTRRALREAVRHEAPALRDAVLDCFAFNVDTLKGVLSDDTLDKVAANALSVRLGDTQIAHDVYEDIRDQIISSPERWHGLDVSVSLSKWGQGPRSGEHTMFVANIRWQYRVRPTGSSMRFSCVSDQDEYRELLRDPAVTSVWYLDPRGGIDAGSPDAFTLLHFDVDGKRKKIRRSQRTASQVYTVDLGPSATDGKEVHITYSYQVLVQRHGHLLYLDLPRPTKGIHVRLEYGGVGIRRINTLDYFASSVGSRIDETPRSASTKTVDISFDRWSFPRAGVAFVWVLEDEIQAPKRLGTGSSGAPGVTTPPVTRNASAKQPARRSASGGLTIL